MSDLVVIAFPSEAKAEEVRHKLRQSRDLDYGSLISLGPLVASVRRFRWPDS